MKATDSDGDVSTTTLSIGVRDDGPVLGRRVGGAQESDLVDGEISITRTLSHDFGEDGAGDITPTGRFSAVFEAGELVKS